LAAGCPQIIFPLFADQAANARCVEAAQVGLSLLDDTAGGAAALRGTRTTMLVCVRLEEVLFASSVRLRRLEDRHFDGPAAKSRTDRSRR
jgi:hypothetical protein